MILYHPLLRRCLTTAVPRRDGFNARHMLSRQNELPRLPIPTLESTAHTYLASIRPLVNDDSFLNTQHVVQQFLSPEGVGPILQQRLVQYDKDQPYSWLEDIWLKYAYLIWRCPTMLNVNWWCQFVDPAPNSIPNVTIPTVLPPPGTFTQTQINRAAGLVAGFLDANNAIQSGLIPIEVMKDNKVLCMNQYTKLFGGSRIPKLGCDIIHNPWPTASRHIIVLIRNQIIKLDVLGPQGERPSITAIHAALSSAIDLVTTNTTTEQPPIGLLTAENRDVWANAYTELETSSSVNKTTLQVINSALFVLALDDSTFGLSVEDTHHQIFHNHGYNRWFDKPITLCVLPTGRAGVNGEHSPSDAVVPGAVFNMILAQEAKLHSQRNKGANIVLPAPQLMKWEVPVSIHTTLQQAQVSVKKAVDSLQSYLLHDSNGRVGGSEWIKSNGKMSPDSYVQMALQLAYYRNMHHIPPTYESASTRSYLHGRTECVRSQSIESKQFVESWDRLHISPAMKVKLLRDAAKVHQSTLRQASLGLGCDRHLLGLKLMLQDNESIPNLFTDSNFTLSQTFQLSTSNMSPGKYIYGGFGAVTANGYGINYAIDRDQFKFSVSAWCGADTNARNMRDTLKTTLEDIYVTINKVGD